MFRSDNLFSRFMNTLFDVICIGILWILFSLPLLTSGAATTAAYYAMAKSVRFKTGYAHREFWRSFRLNLKQSVPLSALQILAGGILAIDIWYVWNNESKWNNGLFMILLLVLFILTGISIYSWPLLSRFEKNNSELIKTAVVLLFRYLPVTLLIIAVLTGFGIFIYLMPWAVFLLPGIYLFLLTFPMEWIMKKLMPKVEEDSIEAKKWYYE